MRDEIVEKVRALAASDPEAFAALVDELFGDGLHEVLELRVNLTAALYGPDGQLKESRTFHNLIVTAGKNTLLDADVGDAKTIRTYSYVGMGTGTTAAVIGNTALETEVGTRVAGTLSNPAATTLRIVASFGPGVGTGAITEAGLFDASSGGVMLARQVFAAYNKAAGDTLVFTWDLT